MGKTEKSRLPVYQTERRQAENSTGEYILPRKNNTTAGERAQGFFESILPKGEENALSAEALRRIAGLNDTRIISKLISDERAAGAVILSSGAGYFLPDEGEKGRREAEAFVAAVTARGVNTIRAVHSAKAYLDKLPGQMEIRPCQKAQ